jgi:chromosome segregation ATPase
MKDFLIPAISVLGVIVGYIFARKESSARAKKLLSEAKKTDMETETASLSNEIKRFDVFNAALATWNDVAESLKIEIFHFREENKELKLENAALMKELAVIGHDNTVLGREVGALTALSKDMISKMTKLQSLNETLIGEVELLRTENKSLKSQISILSRSINSLKKPCDEQLHPG